MPDDPNRVTIRDVYQQVSDLRKEVANSYVQKDTFESRLKPVERLVFGVAGIVLVSIVTAVVTFFIK